MPRSSRSFRASSEHRRGCRGDLFVQPKSDSVLYSRCDQCKTGPRGRSSRSAGRRPRSCSPPRSPRSRSERSCPERSLAAAHCGSRRHLTGLTVSPTSTISRLMQVLVGFLLELDQRGSCPLHPCCAPQCVCVHLLDDAVGLGQNSGAESVCNMPDAPPSEHGYVIVLAEGGCRR